MEVAGILLLKINRCNQFAMLEEREKAFYETFLKKSVEEIAEIALLTRGQAAAERFVKYAAFICLTVCCAFYMTHLITDGGIKSGSIELQAPQPTGSKQGGQCSKR